MKKKIWLSSFLVVTMLFSFGIGVMAAPKLSVWFNNKAQKTDIRLINKKPYVPLNDVATWFEGKVTYDKKANVYKVTSKDFDPASKAKSYTVNINQTSGPMKLTISKVTVDPAYKKDSYSDKIKAVVLEVKVQNTSKNIVNWHPAQGVFAFNTGEQIEDAVIYSDSVEGKFLGGTIKKGRIAIPVTDSQLDLINTIQANITGAFDEEINRLGEDITFDIKFK